MKISSLSTPRKLFLAAAVIVAVLLVYWLAFARTSDRSPQVAHGERPNIVVIQTDDQNRHTFKGEFRDRSGRQRLIMPRTIRGIVDQGAEFTNYYSSTPVCSPSRASLMTGQYSDNNGLLRNNGPTGGWSGWQGLQTWDHNVPLTLQEAGYRTAHYGKLMNGYWDARNNGVDLTVPPGWDRWFTTAYLEGAQYYGFRVNSDGEAVGPFGDPDYSLGVPGITPPTGIDPAGCKAMTPRSPDGVPCNYQSDVTTRRAVEEIKRNGENPDQPFYLQVDYQAPHGDKRPPGGPTPPTRYLGSADRTGLPRNPSVNEADMSDKPERTQRSAGPPISPLNMARLTRAYRRYVETVRGVDDGVGAILNALEKTGQMDNTYVFFLSDQGEFYGEHRFVRGKFQPFEPSARVGMAVRGPGIKPGTKTAELTGNIDVPATVLQLARTKADYKVDGRTMVPFWKNPKQRTRRPYQIAYFGGLEGESDAVVGTGEKGVATGKLITVVGRAPSVPYRGYRIGPYKYFRYQTGERELYDLSNDPYELDNRIADPQYAQVKRYMQKHYRRVINCAGASCRAPLPPWPEPPDVSGS